MVEYHSLVDLDKLDWPMAIWGGSERREAGFATNFASDFEGMRLVTCLFDAATEAGGVAAHLGGAMSGGVDLLHEPVLQVLEHTRLHDK